MAVGLMLAANVATLIRDAKTTLHSFYYITPLYFIETEFDIIKFRPLWSLDDISVTHNYKNGSYQSSTLSMKFGSEAAALTIPSKEQVESFFKVLQTSDARARSDRCDGSVRRFTKRRRRRAHRGADPKLGRTERGFRRHRNTRQGMETARIGRPFLLHPVIRREAWLERFRWAADRRHHLGRALRLASLRAMAKGSAEGLGLAGVRDSAPQA